jgi:cyclic pyranopterin phosphate synthase
VNVASRKNELTHVDKEGRARMVDVTDKAETVRVARAEASVEMSPDTVRLLRERQIPKGDPLEVARIAGIQAGKKTSELIPLCHPLALTHLDVSIEIVDSGAKVEAVARTKGETGVEMEALTAAAVACLTLYDMCKAVEKGISIGPIRLVEKSGGKSGHWVAKIIGTGTEHKRHKRNTKSTRNWLALFMCLLCSFLCLLYSFPKA